MQNDWVKWISMIEFSDNVNTFLIISMISFYFNKEFHSWMSFDSDTTDYKITHEWIKVKKANDIIIWMKELLNFNHQQLKKTKLIIEVQINKHKRDIIYEINDQIWLSFRNIKIIRSCKNLKDKQLDFYSIIFKVKTFYHFHLFTSMKHIHLMFSFKILQLYLNDSLSDQHIESLRSITIEDEEHWKINDILNFKCYQDQMQYKVKWKDLDKDDDWYYVDKEKFNDFKKVLNEFHILHSNKSR